MKPKHKAKRGKPDPAIIADIVQSVVSASTPDKIILFGSAARGEMGPNSDYDILVIKGGKYNQWRVLTQIYKHLPPAAIDLVLATPEVIELYRDTHCLVYCSALKDGKVIYDSKAHSTHRSARVAQPGSKQSRVRQGSCQRRVS